MMKALDGSEVKLQTFITSYYTKFHVISGDVSEKYTSNFRVRLS